MTPDITISEEKVMLLDCSKAARCVKRGQKYEMCNIQKENPAAEV